ncbi:hypothetical protein BK712_01335 [Bacillus thuringiensis serovar seoulensis]|nr:hypothetical protein BK712_01335 [Bacillus thuringiensis serovar seoulensis]
MTYSLCNPLVVSKHYRFDLPTGEGASQEWEVGGGMFFYGDPRGFPWSSWGAKPPVFVCETHTWRSQKEPVRAHLYVVKYSALYFI